MKLGSKMLEVISARIRSDIINMKKFCNPGISTNKPAESPAQVVVVVSKIV